MAVPVSGFPGRRRALGRAGPEAEAEAEAEMSAERRRGTMRPAEARAARVGQGGARVAECVCVRLSVKADKIGRAHV